MKKLGLLLIICLLLVGCDNVAEQWSGTTLARKAPASFEQVSQSQDKPAEKASSLSTSENASITSSKRVESAETKTKIIRNASTKIQVKNYSKSRSSIGAIVKKNNGYIAAENESNSGYSIENTMIIRVHNQNFENLLNELMTEASYIYNKNITSEDVTEKFVDMQARLVTKKEIEKRYLEILKEAKNVQDILAVEKEMRVLREEIDATEGKLRYMNDQVLYSTITLVFYQELEHATAPGPGFFKKSWEAIKGGWENLLNFMVGLLFIWPFILVIGLIVYAIIRRRRRRQK